MGEELSQVTRLRKRLQKGEISLKEFQSEKERLQKLHGMSTTKTEPDDARPWRWLLYFLVAAPLVVFFGVIGLIMWGPKDESNSIQADILKEERRIEKLCREAVLDQLKAPSSAEFERLATISTGNATWTVRGQVDSQNGFGAQVRTEFACVISPNSSVSDVQVVFE